MVGSACLAFLDSFLRPVLLPERLEFGLRDLAVILKKFRQRAVTRAQWVILGECVDLFLRDHAISQKST